MSSIYQDLGVEPIINASGTVTAYSGTLMWPEVSDAMNQASRAFVVMEELHLAAGKRIAGFGAPGKGNTLLNYCGIGTDVRDFTVDSNPAKQGTYTPGARNPILDPAVIFTEKPDYLLLLPWNLRAEIAAKLAGIRDWGGRFVVPEPRGGAVCGRAGRAP